MECDYFVHIDCVQSIMACKNIIHNIFLNMSLVTKSHWNLFYFSKSLTLRTRISNHQLIKFRSVDTLIISKYFMRLSNPIKMFKNIISNYPNLHTFHIHFDDQNINILCKLLPISVNKLIIEKHSILEMNDTLNINHLVSLHTLRFRTFNSIKLGKIYKLRRLKKLECYFDVSNCDSRLFTCLYLRNENVLYDYRVSMLQKLYLCNYIWSEDVGLFNVINLINLMICRAPNLSYITTLTKLTKLWIKKASNLICLKNLTNLLSLTLLNSKVINFEDCVNLTKLEINNVRSLSCGSTKLKTLMYNNQKII